MNNIFPNADPSQTAVFGVINPDASPELENVPLSAQHRAAVAALPPHAALLIVQRGPNAGSRFLLDAERTMAGRNPNADIFLDDVTVSRTHAMFVATPSGFAVRDSGSLNGTYVNRERIDQCELHVGDEVQIGKYRLTYHPSPARSQ